ncbi:MAG: DUF4349 domain-containing protein [Candidatus Magasanikbacteria bacterium]|nr:DUF4349 domain-containing protein [Candidatus Magasanikbacteria bacterium]
MFFTNPLDNKLRKWGKAKQELPASVSAMKEKVLASVKPKAEPLPKTKNRTPYWFVLSGALAALVLFIGQYTLRQINTPVADSGFGIASQEQMALSSKYEEENLASDMVTPNVTPSDLGIQYGEATGLGGRSYEDSMVEKVSNFISTGQDRNGAISDAREFLKYDYSATIKTRKVEQISSRVQTIVRGHGGRVDNMYVQEKHGYVYFVVPKSSLEAFKNEIKGLVNVRFYTESVRAQNLLPEKVIIEKSTETAKESLASLEGELAILTKEHNTRISDLQKQLNGVVASINRLRNEVTTSTVRQEEIKRDISRLSAVQQKLQRQITDENQNYNSQKFYLDDRIKNAKSEISNLAEQDQNLQDNVETVQGSVEVEWVSIFEIIKLYVPYYWAWVLSFCAIALAVNYFSKRRTIEAL